MHAKQGAVRLAGESGAGFREPDELRQLRETHVLAHRTRRIEQRLFAQAAVLETSAKAGHGLALSRLVTVHHPTYSLCSNAVGDAWLHLNK